MNKSIFQKIKKSNLESISESPYSQKQIQYMSVQDMEKTLLTHINSSRGSSPQNVAGSGNNESERNNSRNIASSMASRNSLGESRRVPELVMENDQLKYEIQKLKNDKKLILSQYENLSTFNKNYIEYQADKKQNQRQFSFRKSVENVQKIISNQERQQQKPARQQNGSRQRQFGSINQRNVLSSDENRNSRHSTQRREGMSLQSSKGIVPNLRRSRSRQTFSTLQERFYEYCKKQMVRMNTENTKLNLKIGELQTKITSMQKQYEMLEQQNINLRNINESLEEKLQSENVRIQKINQQMSVTLTKKEQIVQNQFNVLQNQLKDLRSQQERLRRSIFQKDAQISTLKGETSKMSSQCKNYAELVSRNVALQNELNQVMIRNKKLGDKFRRMPVIDHLWEIKQVEYQNLINLIQKETHEIHSLQQSRAKQQRKNYKDAFDLTFSKQQRHF